MTTQNQALSSRRGAERVAARQASAAGGTQPAAPAPKALTASDMQAIQADARKRVIAGYTMAKTLLPQADTAIQAKFAAALIQAPTNLVTAAFREVALLAAKAKQASDFEGGMKTELNVILEKPELLSRLKNEVESELKGEAKTAKVKTAAPGDPGEEEKKPEGEEGAIDDLPPADPANAEGAGSEPPLPPAGDEALPPTDAPAEPLPPADGAAPASAEDAGLMGQIEQVEQDVSKLESQATEIQDQALDLAGVFDPAIQADKANSLANEGEGATDDFNGDFFGPSSHGEMEDNLDSSNPQNFFTDAPHTASLQLDAYLGKQAAEVDVDGYEAADHFATDLPADGRNAESDHSDDLLSQVLESISQETMEQTRDVAPKLEEPKGVTAASQQPKRSNVTIGQPALPKQASAGSLDITPAELESMLFRSL